MASEQLRLVKESFRKFPKADLPSATYSAGGLFAICGTADHTAPYLEEPVSLEAAHLLNMFAVPCFGPQPCQGLLLWKHKASTTKNVVNTAC